MENNEKNPLSQIKTPDDITKKVPEKPLFVIDKRSKSVVSGFNLGDFMKDIGVFMRPRNFNEAVGSSKYGGLLSLATAESDGFKNSIENSKAITIVIENEGQTLLEKTKNLTTVRIFSMLGDGLGDETKIYFYPDGSFYNFHWYPRVKIPEDLKLEMNQTDGLDQVLSN